MSTKAASWGIAFVLLWSACMLSALLVSLGLIRLHTEWRMFIMVAAVPFGIWIEELLLKLQPSRLFSGARPYVLGPAYMLPVAIGFAGRLIPWYVPMVAFIFLAMLIRIAWILCKGWSTIGQE